MNGFKKAGLAGTFALCFVLGGCAGTDSSKDKASNTIRIGVTVYDKHDTFISELMDTFTSDVSRMSTETGKSITVEIVDAAASQSTQNEQVENLISKGCDVVCVNLVDRTEPTTITDLAEKNGVPIIFFNRELVAEDLERWDKLFYVGADAQQSGILEGQIVADLYEDKPAIDKNGDGALQYVTLEGEAGHQDAIIRTEYSVSTIMDAGIKVEKLAYARANWIRAQGQTQMASLLEQFGDKIEVIIANNDDMALGAVDALKAAGTVQKDWPVIVGIDGTATGLAAVKNHQLAGTVYNDKKGQAQYMADLAYTLSTDGDLEELPLTDGKYLRTPYMTVTEENVADFR